MRVHSLSPLGVAAFALAAAAGVTASASSVSPLFAALNSATFIHQSQVNSTDVFTYLPISCGYLEAENVTNAQTSWGVGGSCPYLYVQNSSQPAPPCDPSAVSQGDRPGSDIGTVVVPTDDYTLCVAACCENQACDAWVYASSAPFVFGTCAVGDHCCYLKSGAPAQKADPGLVNGVINNRTNGGGGIVPPIGMRSAPPLGGVGAGAMELRADGTFHEVTIVNQSPAGAAKFGTLGDAVLAVRGGTDTRTVRTHPPAYAQGVSQLLFSGSYPLTRLTLNDPSFSLGAGTSSVYAYSTLVPGDMKASAYPAVTFSFAYTNPTSAPVTTSFMVSMPFGAVNDCARTSAKLLPSPSNTSTYGDCLLACSATAGCASWTWIAATGKCSLASDVPWSVYARGSYCGVQGGWTSDGASLSLLMYPAGGAGGPANGDVTLTPVMDNGGVTVSLGVANDPSALYNSFAQSGGFVAGNGVLAAGSFVNVSAAHGAAAVTVTVPAGASIASSVVFAWYFPERDHMNVDVGNYYSTIWDSSSTVASELADPEVLASVVSNLNTHHSVFSNPASSMPSWMADTFINQMSHFRGLIWTRDGRLREFEANDCPDVDSIHNDGQRKLPYLWLLPQFEYSKMEKWGSGQASDGHIWEYLGSFGLGPLDIPGGRIMADTTSMWVIELLELFHNTGDAAFLTSWWPTAKNAIAWMIDNAGALNLPQFLVCTYDILDIQVYNTTTFNSFLYLTAMRAGGELATYLGDNATLATTTAAFERGQAAVQTLLWNSTLNYFRAYTGGDAIMSDCLYGQMLAHHHGLGWLMPQQQLAQHLEAEEKYNGNPYGFTVLTGRHEPPPMLNEAYAKHLAANSSSLRVRQSVMNSFAIAQSLGIDTQDDTCWMGAAPTWSYIALNLNASISPAGGNVTAALMPAMRSMENFRTRLADMWNPTGLTSTDDWGSEAANGQPYITSHYGFLLPDYYLVPALAGQQVNIPAGTLSFNPLYSCPFNLPVTLVGTTGTVACDASSNYVLTIAFGKLTLPAGGLSVNGNAYAGAVNIGPGESVSWS